MNFDLSEEQQMLAETATRLFDGHARQAEPDAKAQWRDYQELGLIALPLPAALDGLGGGEEEIMLVMQAYGAACGTAPYLQSVLLSGRLLAEAGGENGERALSALLAGERQYALCLFEPDSRYRWDEPATRAEQIDNGWRLTGAKVAVCDAGADSWLICPAAVEGGLGLFLVPPGAAGVAREEGIAPDGRPSANIRFDGVMLADDAAIGDPAMNRAHLARIVDQAIAACCAEAVGAMEKLLDITVDYMATREQFGTAIGTFQALQHRAADMLVEIEQARSITIYAISMMAATEAERHVAVSAAKALVNRASRFVGCEAVQLHGGMGLTSEYPAGRFFQRLTTLENLFGDTHHHLCEVERGGGV